MRDGCISSKRHVFFLVFLNDKASKSMKRKFHFQFHKGNGPQLFPRFIFFLSYSGRFCLWVNSMNVMTISRQQRFISFSVTASSINKRYLHLLGFFLNIPRCWWWDHDIENCAGRILLLLLSCRLQSSHNLIFLYNKKNLKVNSVHQM